MSTETQNQDQLLNIEQLRDALFAPGARPCIRTIRTLAKNKTIPSIKLGALVFFRLGDVREALAKLPPGGARRRKKIASENVSVAD